ncbi:hypothetical protein [Sandaracinus amylolyticus]|uniref:hypothetical protein n=1 Tax=Sandaracinus amylolyticus TaxID=927083 RepID=UPI001F181B79|nr:hypothetical protein [Sandaracinus amylolyticus]UJR85168.1 Hypothetical protein I5071_72480 [Sandaracinus amylolyticus]
MIIELAVSAAAVVVASAVARAIVQRRAAQDAEREKRLAAAARANDPRRGLRVGDVLLHVGDELWLAGMIELDEEGTLLSIFRAPENTRTAWVAQLDDEARELALLSHSDEVPEGHVPDRLPLGGRVLSLLRRGSAKVRGHGEHLPPHGAKARFTILHDAGGRVAMVIDFEGAPRLTLVGDRVERALIDVLPGGERGPE